MKLIKINTDHYVIVDDLLEEIEEGDYVFLSDEIYYVTELNEDFIILDNQTMNSHIGVECEIYKLINKITHSTQPLGKPMLFTNAFESDLAITTMGLHDTVIENWGCKKLSLSEVKELIGEVDVKVKAENYIEKRRDKRKVKWFGKRKVDIYIHDDFTAGYNQALKDNKDKKWTDADVIRIVEKSRETGLTAEFILLTLQPKTEWEVEYDENGKLKLV